MDLKLDNKRLSMEALKRFANGNNCAQSVLLTYAEILHIDLETALNLTSGFGAGMGRLQETCGAVTGAYMVFGIVAGKQNPENADKKEMANLLIQKYYDKFVVKHKSTDCKILLNCNLRTEEGQQKFETENLIETVCQKCIRDSIELINELVSPF